jgi:transcriptional regulator with XRE-family HTH domain
LKEAQEAARAKRGSAFTLDNLARQLGCRKPTLSLLLNGKQTTFDQLPGLCELLGIPLYSVLQGLDDEDAEILAAFHELKKAKLSKAELEGLRLKVAGLKSRTSGSPDKNRGN